jgi:putative phosphoribosyl transferase
MLKHLVEEHEVLVDVGEAMLRGKLAIAEGARGVVLFAHGNGSGRNSPRDQFVASSLQKQAISTLLVDLFTKEEADEDEYSGHLRFDIGLLADRLHRLTRWLEQYPQTAPLPIGYFGASTGAAAALVASIQTPLSVKAIVSRGGRPDLAGAALKDVIAPTLLIVGSLDTQVIALNERAFNQLGAHERQLEIVKGANHLFEETGTLERVAELAGNWFGAHGMQ